METSFRRLAPHLWRDSQDPSTYGEIDIDLTAFEAVKKNNSISLLGILMKALEEGHRAVPQVNSRVILWKVRRRKNFSVSIMVPHKKDDLCFVTLNHLENKNLSQVNQLLREHLDTVKVENGVKAYSAIFAVLNWVPRWFLNFLLPVIQFFLSLNLFKLPLIPRAPFGSIIVSNVGTLGFHRAFLPLVGFSKASLMVSLGKVLTRAVVVDGQVVARPMVTIGFNLDHRIMDGFHAKNFITAFQEVFSFPDKYL